MLTRVPTPTISRTYVRSKINNRGEATYEASVVIAKTGERLTSTRESFDAAVRSARRKAGIRE